MSIRLFGCDFIACSTVLGDEALGGVEFTWVVPAAPLDLQPDVIDSTTEVRLIYQPDLGSNLPMLLAISVQGRLEPVEPLAATGGGAARSVAGVVVTLPAPAVSGGQPSLPDHWAQFGAAAVLIQGPDHIHAIPDPNPVWDPRTSGWTFPPPLVTDGPHGAGELRWSVDTLPDPGGYSGGWYWLGSDVGDVSGHVGINQGWHTSPGSVGDVVWDSFYPFRPSVNSYDGYIPGERTIHHARGVHFNSHFIEHMWADFGAAQLQPFTWIVVATIMSDRFTGYTHHILDAGRDPDDVGFPHLSAADCSVERRINDGLGYRTALSAIGPTTGVLTRSGSPYLASLGSGGHHPKMFVGIYDGADSKVGAYDPFSKVKSTGAVNGDAGVTESHRFPVLGRETDWISQNHSSNMMVFEIRYWHQALTDEDLDAQYAQLSSTHQFDSYKTL